MTESYIALFLICRRQHTWRLTHSGHAPEFTACLIFIQSSSVSWYHLPQASRPQDCVANAARTAARSPGQQLSKHGGSSKLPPPPPPQTLALNISRHTLLLSWEWGVVGLTPGPRWQEGRFGMSIHKECLDYWQKEMRLGMNHKTLGTAFGPQPAERSDEEPWIIFATQKRCAIAGWFLHSIFLSVITGKKGAKSSLYQANFSKAYWRLHNCSEWMRATECPPPSPHLPTLRVLEWHLVNP